MQVLNQLKAVALPTTYQDSFLSSFGVGAYYQDIPSSGDTIKILVITTVYLVHVHLVTLTQIYISRKLTENTNQIADCPGLIEKGLRFCIIAQNKNVETAILSEGRLIEPFHLSSVSIIRSIYMQKCQRNTVKQEYHKAQKYQINIDNIIVIDFVLQKSYCK